MINHHGCDILKASELTRKTLRTHPTTAYQFAITQVWSWADGDAIVLVVGDLGHSVGVVVLRLGDKCHVVRDASLNSALAAYGRSTKTGERLAA